MPWKRVEPMNQKKEFVLKALRTNNFRQLCEEYEISAKTGYKWRGRFFEHGFEGLEEVSRRPLSHAREVRERGVCGVVRLKHAHPKGGARERCTVYPRVHDEVPRERRFNRGVWAGGFGGGAAAQAPERGGADFFWSQGQGSQ